MRELCSDECYTPIGLKQNVQEYFQSAVIITEINGLPYFVTFMSTASSILLKFFEKPRHHDSERNNYASVRRQKH